MSGKQNLYQTLGVNPTATLDDIKRAYRQECFRCHPDKGGSHEQMVALNEAWEILSDQKLRTQYDQILADFANSASQSQWENMSREVRAKAEQYPRRWEDFVRFMDAVAQDISNAIYGKVNVIGPYHYPTVAGSGSGFLFIGIGTVLGLIGGILAALDTGNHKRVPPSPPPPGLAELFRGSFRIPTTTPATPMSSRPPLVPVINNPRLDPLTRIRWLLMMPIGGAIAGAWLGKYLHSFLKYIIKTFYKITHAIQRSRLNRRLKNNLHSGEDSMRFVTCCVCGKRLRIPQTGRTLEVTCPMCRNRFLEKG